MKYGLFTVVLGVTLVMGSITAPRAALAVDQPGAHHETAMKGEPSARAGTLGGLWHDVKAREGELNSLINAKELGNVHEVAFAIRDLVAALPNKSAQLSAEQQAKLTGNVKYVATIAQRLDAAGDTKDQKAAEAQFKEMQSVLGAIEALYPAEALK